MEAKFFENEKNMESLKQYMVDILKDNNMDKVLQPKVTFTIDTSKYKIPYHNPHKRYSFVEKGSNSKSTSSHIIYCHYCCKGHTIAKCKFRRLFIHKGVYQWLPKCNQGLINPQGPNEDWVPSFFSLILQDKCLCSMKRV